MSHWNFICPHKGGPLSQGLVQGRQGSCASFEVKLEDGQVWLALN